MGDSRPASRGARCPDCFAVVLPTMGTIRCDCGVRLRPVKVDAQMKCPSCGSVHNPPDPRYRCSCGRLVTAKEVASQPRPNRAKTVGSSVSETRPPSPPSARVPEPAPKRRPVSLTPRPVTGGGGICPCGCGRRLGFWRGAGKGYRWAWDATRRIEAHRLDLDRNPQVPAQLAESLYENVTNGVQLCGWWLDHCHRTATPLATPDMKALTEGTGLLLRFADQLDQDARLR